MSINPIDWNKLEDKVFKITNDNGGNKNRELKAEAIAILNQCIDQKSSELDKEAFTAMDAAIVRQMKLTPDSSPARIQEVFQKVRRLLDTGD